MSERDVVICAPVRTDIGTYNGSVKEVPSTALGAAVISETLKRSGISPASIDSVASPHGQSCMRNCDVDTRPRPATCR